ncbi:unnamed protein product [Didymodactylos carnosus]|uniref:Uncharacterized protein n=1 Tax=Didymodactylos carnosus TaxID=1234261 RepID=A0A815U0R1_9BILA|nr:unnamed protein product [Didymodactylos carnosus]CAF1510003.1 unnamed protein product [Didymodactylos carnosus]CAF4181754.1 unnamed protein product [Didymodactylos carnosus]CAF4370842.1 unnamed protein product [Didymodactylos carnosus]
MCMKGGKIFQNKIDKRPEYVCKRSFALDLFLSNSSYPSIIAEGATPLDDKLYVNVLNKSFRSNDSIWGLIFNFESIIYYPWAGDRKRLKLFDITYGYDRSLYDLTPRPWLFACIDRLTNISIEKAIQNKKEISSNVTTYWTNTQRKESSI